MAQFLIWTTPCAKPIMVIVRHSYPPSLAALNARGAGRDVELEIREPADQLANRRRPGRMAGTLRPSPPFGPAGKRLFGGLCRAMNAGAEWLIDAIGCRGDSLADVDVLAQRLPGDHRRAGVARGRRRALAPVSSARRRYGVVSADRVPPVAAHLSRKTASPRSTSIAAGRGGWAWEERLAALLGAARTTVRNRPAARPGSPAGQDRGAENTSPRSARRSPDERRASGVSGLRGAVVFRLGTSLVTVCEYCHSVVARGDRSVDDLGKIAYLAETDSPLEVGHEGALSRPCV